MLKKYLVAALLLANINLVFAWASTGHRVIGQVAEKNIKKRTLKKINHLLNYQSLASISTYGDDVKSDKAYNKYYSWHFVNFEFGKKYEDCPHNDEGDIISGIQKCIDILKDKNSSDTDKAFHLKFLVHLVGDLHQPLHVGNGADKGGNDIKLTWFGEETNLHRVWDSDMIDHYQMSYTELSNDLPYLTKTEKKSIQEGSVLDWAYESQKIAFNQVYSSAKTGENLQYRYQYLNFGIVKQQLERGGLRLAKLLDEIFA